MNKLNTIKAKTREFISKHSIRRILLVIMIVLAVLGISLTAIGTFSNKYSIKRVTFTNKTFYIKTELYGETYLKDIYGEQYENISLIPDRHKIFEIQGYEITPTGFPSNYKFPCIIWSHGMVANVDFQLHYALEFVYAGFKVIAVNLEGMGSSGGYWDLGVTDPQVIYSAVEYASKLNDVDIDRIAVSGHSNGGLAVARAGVFDKSPLGTGGLIKSVGSIWCVSDFNETMIELVGGEDPTYNSNYGWFIPLFYGSTKDEVVPNDIIRRSVSDYINSTNIPNWYLISGTKDQFSSADIMYDVMAAANEDNPTNVELKGYIENQFSNSKNGFWNNSISNQKIQDGTARKLFIQEGLDHIGEAMSPKIVQELIDWFILTLNLDEQSHISRIEQGFPVMITWIVRFIGIFTMVFALILSQFVVGAYLAPAMFPDQRLKYKMIKSEEDLEKQRKEDDDNYISPMLQDYFIDVEIEEPRELFSLFMNTWKKKALFLVLMTLCIVIGIGLFFEILPYPVTRFWEFNAFIYQFFFAGVVMWILALIVLYYYKNSEEYGPYVNLTRLGASWEGLVKGLLYAIIVAIIPATLYNIVSYFVYSPMFLPRPFSEAGLYSEVIFGAFMIWMLYLPLETLTKTQLFAIKRRFKTKGGYWLEVLINAGLVFIIWFVGYLGGMIFLSPELIRMILSGSFGGTIFFGVISIMFILNGLGAFLTAFIYQRTRNLFACSFYPVCLFSLIIFGKFFGIYSAF